MIRYSLFILCLFITASAWAQQASDPIVIQKEEMNYRLYALKNKYTSKSETITSFEMECDREYRIESEEGIGLLREIVLPEPIDPLYREVAPESREAHFFLQDIKIKEMSLSVKRGGKNIAVDTKKSELREERILIEADNIYGNANEYAYTLPRLRVGDVVKLHYLVSIPFAQNWKELLSFRIFFHGPWKKESSRVRFAYTDGAPILINYMNGSEPDNSFPLDLITDKWDFKNLPGALAEDHARPYKELPHLQIFCEPSIIGVPQPERHKRMFAHQLAIQIGSTYKQYQLLYAFLERQITDQDTHSFARLQSVFNPIAADFTYDPDTTFYQGEQLFDANFGEDLMNFRVRESNKYETYAAALNALQQPYHLVYAMDNRFGELGKTYSKPKVRGDFLFAPNFENGTMVFLYPKFMTCGLFLEELPFYFENTTLEVQYMNQEKLRAGSLIDEIYARKENQFIDAPVSTVNENYRTTHSKVNVSLDEGTLDFDTRMTLSGQFSTLTRSNYVCDEAFPNVDTTYHQKVWDGLHATRVRHETTGQSDQFPFQTKVQASYRATSNVGDEVFQVSLDHWFKHVAHSIDTTDRQLSYYPDFQSTDSYTYMLQFDSPVEFIDLPESITEVNEVGSYQFEAKPMSDQAVQIMSSLKINVNEVKPEQLRLLKTLYDHALRDQPVIQCAVGESGSNRSSTCIERILAADDSLGRARNHACEQQPLSEVIANYASALAGLDFTSCPENFRAAFEGHRQAWLELLPITDRYPDLRGEMHALFEKLESGEHAKQFKPMVDRVWKTWAEVEAASKQ